jgi:Chaperone of endosialidase
MEMKRFIFSFLLSFVFYLLSSQSPQGFNYQAIARDGSGNPIVNTNLQVKLAVMADSLGSTVYWEELFNPVTTNAYGLFAVILGQGSRQGTSNVATFSNINWNSWPLFVRTQIYYQNNWKNMGSSRLWSVPYSMVSNKAITANSLTGTVPQLSVGGNTTVMDSALFVVRNNTGQIIFAVYNEGVRIYVDDGVAKGAAKGGFAIGGFGTAKGTSQEYFRVTRDSTRVYVNQLAKGAAKGGFAIGGFSPAKGNDTTRFMNITPQNYIIGYGAGKSITTGLYNNFMGYQAGYNTDVGGYNTFIGFQAGKGNSGGNSNVLIGYQAGESNTSGTGNVFIGLGSGQDFQTGYNNTYIGTLAGQNITNGNSNIFIGRSAGTGYNFPTGTIGGTNNIIIGNYSAFYLTTGMNNAIFGNSSGFSNTSGYENLFAGNQSGYSNTAGSENVLLGSYSGYSNSTGIQNVFIGNKAGWDSQNGNGNVFIGNQSGYNNISGGGNVFIGYGSGGSLTSQSNKLYIENSAGDNTTSLIYGDFSTAYLRLNASVDIKNSINFPNQGASIFEGGKEALWFNGTYYSWGFGGTYNYFAKPVTIGNTANPSYMLYVQGTTYSSGGYASSDIRWKKNLQPIIDIMPGILQLEGYRFSWRRDEFPGMNFDESTQIGLIAQEVEKVFPELVKTDNNGYKAISYEKLSVLLLEGMKEQEKKIESSKQENDKLRSDLESLKADIQQIRAQVSANENK